MTEELMERLVHLTEGADGCLYGDEQMTRTESVSLQGTGVAAFFSWLQTGHFTPVSSLASRRISSACCLIKN